MQFNNLKKILTCGLISTLLFTTGCSMPNLKFWEKQTTEETTAESSTTEVVYDALTVPEEVELGTTLVAKDLFDGSGDVHVQSAKFIVSEEEQPEEYLCETEGEVELQVYAMFEDGQEFLGPISFNVKSLSKIPENLFNWLMKDNNTESDIFTIRSEWEQTDVSTWRSNATGDSIVLGKYDGSIKVSLNENIKEYLKLSKGDIPDTYLAQVDSFLAEPETSGTDVIIYNVNGTEYPLTLHTEYLGLPNEEGTKVLTQVGVYYTFTVDGQEYFYVFRPHPYEDPVMPTFEEADFKDEETFKAALDKYFRENVFYTGGETITLDFILVGTKDFYALEDAEGEEVDETVEDVAGKTYAEKHPDLFTWPASTLMYRKWVYTISEDTGYQGSIISPDGVVSSTAEIGSSTGSTSNAPVGDSVGSTADIDVTGDMKVTIDVSAFGYELYRAGNKLQYKDGSSGIVYTLELTNKSTLNNYLKKTYMTIDGTASIDESSSYLTDIGKAGEYTITVNKDGAETSGAYLVYTEVTNAEDKVFVVTASSPASNAVMKNLITSIKKK